MRKVRWYTEEEYAKYYPNQNPKAPVKTQKEVLGFTFNYITIFKGNTYSHLEWFRASIAKYDKRWGWYITSDENVPFDLPAGLEPIRLSWNMVGDEDGLLKDADEIRKIVDGLIYEPSGSEFVGEPGARLELELTVREANKGSSYYGDYTVHHMEDAAGNKFMWNTSVKTWEVGKTYHIKATVKEHKVFRNVNTTILTRCTEVK